MFTRRRVLLLISIFALMLISMGALACSPINHHSEKAIHSFPLLRMEGMAI